MPDMKECVLGIELGSTRIKAVLLDGRHTPIATGSYEWENQYENGIWTYSMDAVTAGLRACYADIKRDVREKFGVTLTSVGAIGISGMMHGYLPFDAEGNQLAKFRTWRNTVTGEAAARLTSLFGFNIPQRWSIAHLYQAILNGEEHVSRVARLTTLAGHVHYLLTGEHVTGIGEASGMFPVDSQTLDYDENMVRTFDSVHGQPWKLRDILPRVLPAGTCGGYLTPDGARFLDPEGDLLAGIPLAPCEGDAGTGMTATNSVRPRTGNVSAGTSVFALLVTERPLGVHREINMVTTPDGAPVALVHGSNCTSDINAWVGLLGEFATAIGADIDRGELFTLLFNKALEGEPDCGGLVSFNYFSGEAITGLDAGRPLFLRTPDARLTLANFMRTHLLSALSTLKLGLDMLKKEEDVKVDKLYAHGGFFKTPGVGQRLLSAAVGAPVSVMETAGEGGPYGMALLCAYMLYRQPGESLADYLDNRVFADASSTTVTADETDVAGFAKFLDAYVAALPVERKAVEVL